MVDEPGQYCGCHPATKRAVLNGMEGLTISGVPCKYRRLVGSMGWQSFCSRFDRIEKGCETALMGYTSLEEQEDYYSDLEELRL